jgi:hypothetical protein
MPALPKVPVPPTHLSAPHTASVVFLVLCSVILVVAVVYVVRQAIKGDRIGLLFLLGGLLAGILEPMLDSLGLLWFARDNVAVAVHTFHRFIPLYVVMGYAFFFGGFSYVAYRAMLAGRSPRWFWGLFACCWLADLALQATGSELGLYHYYGHQPLLLFGTPAWWFTIDAALPVLAGGVIFLLRRELLGWRSLTIIVLIPGMYAGLNAAAGWPVFSALNSGASGVVMWLAGLATIALAVLFRWLMLLALAPSLRQLAPEPGGLPPRVVPSPALSLDATPAR